MRRLVLLLCVAACQAEDGAALPPIGSARFDLAPAFVATSMSNGTSHECSGIHFPPTSEDQCVDKHVVTASSDDGRTITLTRPIPENVSPSATVVIPSGTVPSWSMELRQGSASWETKSGAALKGTLTITSGSETTLAVDHVELVSLDGKETLVTSGSFVLNGCSTNPDASATCHAGSGKTTAAEDSQRL